MPLQVALALGIEQLYFKFKERRQHGTLTEDTNHGKRKDNYSN